MVSGFLISPNDQLRIRSGEARPIWIWSKVSGLAIWLVNLLSSFIIFVLVPRPLAGGVRGGFFGQALRWDRPTLDPSREREGRRVYSAGPIRQPGRNLRRLHRQSATTTRRSGPASAFP